jgi:hypothetical protein
MIIRTMGKELCSILLLNNHVGLKEIFILLVVIMCLTRVKATTLRTNSLNLKVHLSVAQVWHQ